MSNEMIERVMFAIVNRRRTSFNIPVLTDLKHLTEEAYGDYKLQAVAAIQAMREPTEEMIDEVEQKFLRMGPTYKYIHQAMIDAALKE